MLIRYPIQKYKQKTLIKVSKKGGEWASGTQQVPPRQHGRTDGLTYEMGVK